MITIISILTEQLDTDCTQVHVHVLTHDLNYDIYMYTHMYM